MKNILWLSSWYPNRLDPLIGDFIERHARAAGTRNNIFVLHVVKDQWPVTGTSAESRAYPENVEAKIIYYRHRPLRLRWLNTLLSNIRYFRAHQKAIRKYVQENGRPACIHVHIALKAGLIARYYQITRGIPYVVSEQWTGICAEASPNMNSRSRMFRFCWKQVMRHAANYSAVSDYLISEMQTRFGIARGQLIPNVVDGSVFFPQQRQDDRIVFGHVSTLKYQKNPEQLLEATAILRKKGYPFTLAVVGPHHPWLQALARQLGISDVVDFRGTITHEAVAVFLRSVHALILCSRFETFGCVVIEANASGAPVIVSNIPVMRENVQEGVNGWLVPLDDPGELASAMEKIILQKNVFDPSALHAATSTRYSFERIGKLFDELYQSLKEK